MENDIRPTGESNTPKEKAGARRISRLARWIPRSAEDWKCLAGLVVMILLLVGSVGYVVLMGILKLWALFKYVFS